MERSELIKISNENLKIVEDWVNNSDWVKFMCEDKNTRSSTSITLLIKDEWFNKFNEEEQRNVIKKIVSKLDKEGVAKTLLVTLKHLLVLDYGVEQQFKIMI